MLKSKKIGIMGGTFDPIHNGHIAIAKRAYEQFGLDKVLFIPSGISYLKKDKNVSSSDIRFKMVELSIMDYPYFEASTIEIERAGDTYTFETLQELKSLYPDSMLYFILGADSLLYIDKWYKPEIIFENCTLICAVRDDADINVIKAKGRELEKSGARILYLDIEAIDISSTKIREAVKLNNSISSFVPKSVEEYILQEHLYEDT